MKLPLVLVVSLVLLKEADGLYHDTKIKYFNKDLIFIFILFSDNIWYQNP